MFPSEVVESPLGRSLVAAADLEAGTAVSCFEGPVVRYSEVPAEEIRHVLWVAPDQWMIPTTPARFLNHSCDPCCVLVGGEVDLTVVTRRRVRRGEELTFDYALASPEDLVGPESFWDARWTFRCRCGAVSCRGLIDGYVTGEAGEARR